MATVSVGLEGVEVRGPVTGAYREILTPEALKFVATLAREFNGRREELLQRRKVRQQEIDAGKLPAFLPETATVRQAEWKVAPIPEDLQDRRVEITGPVDRKMIINALNSGANVFMADFEDSNSPTWQQQHRRPDQPARRGQAHHRFRQPGRQAVQAERQDRDAAGASARLAPGGEARAGGWPTDLRLAVRFRPVLLPQRRTTLAREGDGSLLLSAEDGEPPRSAAVERRVQLRAGLRAVFRAARFARPC